MCGTAGHCQSPNFDGGKVVLGGNDMGDIATYKCYIGMKLIGINKRMCRVDGTWSGSTPLCERK